MSVIEFILFSVTLNALSASSFFQQLCLDASVMQIKQDSMKPTNRKKR